MKKLLIGFLITLLMTGCSATYKIKISDKAKDYIIDNSYDESYGARPIKRYVAQNVETLIAMQLINGEIVDNSEILIDVEDNKIIIKK